MDKTLDVFVKLKDYVPFFQTILWLIFIIVIFCILKTQILEIIELSIKRIKNGSAFKAGPFEVGENLEKLDYVPQNQSICAAADEDREKHRISIYEENKGLFLTHIIQPSKDDGQVFDIFIYLIRHKSDDFSDIKKGEFFFGHMWGNQIFEEKFKHGILGIKTSAYAPFLCTCFVTMKDGTVLKLNRYIDFERKN